jgi:16S rRNA (adenine1518-N6/adenine1519-N6)-dimethyltransferase
VIERAAELVPDDVALEIGGGLGVLSEHLAPRVAHLHVVELDRALEAPLRDALAPFDNTTLHMGDALELDLPGLDPAPTKVVANLPYGIAATAILDTVFELPSVTRWVAMVQKEVGERFAATPGSAAYGVPSVLAQLACDVRVHRSVARTVFHPVPNVDSVLVLLSRTGPAPDPGLRALVQGAFGHRRKALPRSLEMWANQHRDRESGPKSLQLHAGDKALRDRARAALAALGLPQDVRAERLTPEQFRDLFAALREAGS